MISHVSTRRRQDDVLGGGSVNTGAVITSTGTTTSDRLLTPVPGAIDRTASGGDDLVLGGAGLDSIHTGADLDVVNAGAGDDVAFAGPEER